jgi:hypothetical protein
MLPAWPPAAPLLPPGLPASLLLGEPVSLGEAGMHCQNHSLSLMQAPGQLAPGNAASEQESQLLQLPPRPPHWLQRPTGALVAAVGE